MRCIIIFVTQDPLKCKILVTVSYTFNHTHVQIITSRTEQKMHRQSLHAKTGTIHFRCYRFACSFTYFYNKKKIV